MVIGAELDPPALEPVTVPVNEPVAVGIQVNKPVVALNVMPVGNAPLVITNVYTGAVLVTAPAPVPSTIGTVVFVIFDVKLYGVPA